MADQVSILAIDNAGPNANGSYDIKSPGYFMRITVQEDFDSSSAPTQDLRQYMPNTGTNPAKISKGTPAIFTKGSVYSPGEVVGGMKTAAGSLNVQVIASGQI